MLRRAGLGLLLLTVLSGGASAQDAPFYKGKTIRIVISTGVAGGYAEYARVLAEHMGRHIAGNPSFIVQSMPGAGGLSATNYLYAQAPQTAPRSASSTRPFRWRRCGAARASVSRHRSSTGSARSTAPTACASPGEVRR